MHQRKFSQPLYGQIGKSTFEQRLRFLVDKSAGIRIAKGLKDFGYDTKFGGDPEFNELTTEALFIAASKERRILITHNTDFLDNSRFASAGNPGIVVIRPNVDGSDDHTIACCLVRVLVLCNQDPAWFTSKKLDFISDKVLTISAYRSHHRYVWKTRADRSGGK